MPLLYYLLAFIEGACVMAAELLGAKMMAPFFGSSLYVWASILGITLGGLALGYFVGGVLSEKNNKERNLYFILLSSSVFLMTMPMLAKTVMVHVSGFSLLTAILISALFFLFPPVFFMGMVSPMIVRCVGFNSGKAAGTVYAISTAGGILSTFFLGFYAIPHFGLSKPAILLGIILGVIPFFKLIASRNFYSLFFLLTVFVSLSGSKPVSIYPGIHIHYSSEGILGQIIVADYPTYDDTVKTGFQRILFVNRSMQTIEEHSKGKIKYFEYVDKIFDFVKPKQGGNALVMGLGGGSIANKLAESGYSPKVVELDARMVQCAKKYFNLSDKVTVFEDDARHYLQATDKGNNAVIVLDAFVGEVNPHHLFTKEFFGILRTHLSDSGMLVINGNGFWNGETGRGMRSICKTLTASGFDVQIVPTNSFEDYRNILFIAKKSKNSSGRAFSTSIESIDFSKDIILCDDKPQLEILNAQANKRWREGCLKYLLGGYYSGKDVLLFQ